MTESAARSPADDRDSPRQADAPPSEGRVLQLLYRALDSVSQQAATGGELPEKSPATLLTGSDSRLDSIGFITFIVSVEQEIEDEFGAAMALTEDEELLASPTGPFRTIGALAGYLAERLSAREE